MDDNRNNYENHRQAVQIYGKEEYTLMKMAQYGFWPKNKPLLHEKQPYESMEDFERRQHLRNQYLEEIRKLTELSEDHETIRSSLRQLEAEYLDAQDIEKIKKEINRQMMRESIERRQKRKQEREEAARIRSEEWKRKKAEKILFIGERYSSLLHEAEGDEQKLKRRDLPIIQTDRELAEFLEIDYGKLRGLVYHRDVMKDDHYHRFTVAKKSGGERQIAAPKKTLKSAQRKILDGILAHIDIEPCAHGFIPGRSVISGAKTHQRAGDFVLNMDVKDFFPSIDFVRVRGMFRAMGYSGYIASLLAMLCTYSERLPIVVKGELLQVKASERILPQGSPASPMITNIICRQMDRRLEGLARKYGLCYTRYADDLSFSAENGYRMDTGNPKEVGRLIGAICRILKEEGFEVNPAKTRVLRKNNRQEITGIVINQNEMGVPKPWLKKLRAAIHRCRMMREQGQQIPQRQIEEIHGKIRWLQSVNASRYGKYIQQWEDFRKVGGRR